MDDDPLDLGDLEDLFAGPDYILTDPLIDEIIRNSAVTATEATTSSSPPSQVSVNHQLLNSAVEETNAIEPAQWELLRLSQSNLSAETITANVPPLLSPRMLGNETLPLELNPNVGYDRRAREEAKKRYYAKRERLMYGKQIRYEHRKTIADNRRRIKGRFVKEGEEYDYDPQIKDKHSPGTSDDEASPTQRTI